MTDHNHNHNHNHSHGHDNRHNCNVNNEKDIFLPPTTKKNRKTKTKETKEKENMVLRKLSIACALCGMFLIIETIGGILSGSLAVLSDAAHLFADLAAFAVAIFAAHWARKPASSTHTFGFKRVEALAALCSIGTLWALSAYLFVEAIARIYSLVVLWNFLRDRNNADSENYVGLEDAAASHNVKLVDGKIMSIIAAIGVVVNIILAIVLGEHHVHFPGDDHGHDHCHDHGHGHGHGHIHEHVSSHSKQYFHTANHNVNAKAQTTTTTSTNTTTTTVTTRRTLSEKSGMDDEYGEMTADGNTYVYPEPFELESGEFLPHAQLRYMTYGTLNEERNNVLVVCHALTGNASLHSWWGDLLGPGQAFDTDKYFVVCCNILGSCYGSTGPASPIHGGSNNDNDIDNDHPEQPQQPPQTETYGIHFPDVSVRDSVTLQLHMLQNDLGIKSVKCVIGGSFGGMQAIEHAVQAGSVGSQFAIDDDTGKAVPFVRSVVPIACGAAHTAWQIGISEVQRQAIYADPKWNDGHPDPSDPPLKGLSVARQIGMVTYRTAMGYESKFGRKVRHRDGAAGAAAGGETSSNTHHVPYGRHAQWEVKSYLEYQGWKFLSRFDPVTYIKLTEQLDTHDVGRNRGGKELALSSVKIPAMIMGIDSDILYPIHEQEELANLFPNGHLKVIHSDAGHDGFLLEQEQVAKHIIHFLESHD